MPPKATAVAEHRARLLAAAEVGSWFKGHASPATARTQLDQLELFCRRAGREPEELLTLARKKPQGLRDLVQDYLVAEQAKGRSSRYVLNSWWGVRSFLAHHGAAPPWVPQLKPVSGDDDEDGSETVPSTEQLRAILNVLSARGRAAALLLATSGIRVGVLASQFGPSEGLRLKHLPELALTPEPHFDRTPFLVRIPPHLAKGSTVSRPRGYVTFGTAEAAEAVVAYLKLRIAHGEVLAPNSALIAPDGRGRRSSRVAKDGTRFLVRKALAFTLRTAMDRVKPAGAHWHAHTLRAWFSTQMEVAESRGLISRSRREFFMGHVGRGVDFDYNLDRPKSSERLEDLRSSYQRCESLLSVSPAPTSVAAELRKALLAVAGLTDEEATQHLEDTNDEVLRLLKNRMMGREFSAGARLAVKSSQPPERPHPQKIQRSVLLADAEILLVQGWTFVAKFGSGRVLLQSPAE